MSIKEFYGTSENAVKVQIYAAIIAYCLVAIVQSEMGLNMDTYDVLRIFNVSLLTRMPLVDLFNEASKNEEEVRDSSNYLSVVQLRQLIISKIAKNIFFIFILKFLFFPLQNYLLHITTPLHCD